jgi:hypothetical protein
MKVGGGKSKGSGFERRIAKDIVKAFEKQGIVQRDCWRSVNSGGHTIACGDLEMSERLLKLFPFSVECKFRKKIHWQNFLLGGESEETGWIKQVVDGAKKIEGLIPILVMKENFGPIYVMSCGGDEESRIIPDQLVPWTTFIKNAVKWADKTK